MFLLLACLQLEVYLLLHFQMKLLLMEYVVLTEIIRSPQLPYVIVISYLWVAPNTDLLEKTLASYLIQIYIYTSTKTVNR